MSCKNICKLYDRLIISQSVTFTGGSVIVNIPAGDYINGEKYCIVIAQSIPSTATINSPVVVTIGTGAVQYPLTKCNCAQATVCNIRTRTKYSTRIVTTATGGSFRMLGHSCCAPNDTLASVNGTAPTTETASVE